MGTVVLHTMATPADPEHTPRRPTWTCRACHLDWPCPTAKDALRQEYQRDPLALFVYLGMTLQEAAHDLYTLNPNPGPDPVELHARFMAWVPVTRLIRRALLMRGFLGEQRFPASDYLTRRPDTNSGP
ncbi:hypothetical protein [Micromonospora sp. HM5-17]|uniref:hypothetical protein n=1 Tax=Micromonospora sp. HM5-17 TaxID=2487710 RepID=UPI0018F42D5A|nr:hypothetical protein [Micromonospora sp. HM5-17]